MNPATLKMALNTAIAIRERVKDYREEKAREAYADAYKKLATGDGNLLRQMEKFRKENIIKPKKLPPAAFQESDAAPPEP